MLVPGSNVLKIAMRYLGNQTVKIKPYRETVITDDGRMIPQFDDEIIITGSWQPLNLTTKKFLEIELSQDAANFFTNHPLFSIDRDRASDVAFYNGATWRIRSVTDWQSQDGWKQVLLYRDQDFTNA